jgi:hypothetical protein
MTTRHYLGAHTRAILYALEATTSMTRAQVMAATGVDSDTAKIYLRRCIARGLATTDTTATPPTYSAAPGWRAFLVTVRPPDKPKQPKAPPPCIVEIARRTQPNSVFALGAM